MNRSALLIDAGYLILGAGGVVLGADRRDGIDCDYAAVHQALTEFVEDHSGLPVLRSYWYDGAPGTHGEPSSDQRDIASLPGLKLRLGRVIQGQQKGVDTLITLDLLTLARERAIATAYLFTGDEDLREAVVAAQSIGIQVVLVGTPPTATSRQSFALIDECDAHVVLDEEFWLPHFSEARRGLPPMTLRESVDHDLPEEERARRFGTLYCDQWLAEAYDDMVDRVAANLPVLPVEVDAPLLRAAEMELGELRDREPMRRSIRQGFMAAFVAVVQPDGQ